jgi:hypothetical protein
MGSHIKIKAKYKFICLSDSELAHLYWRRAGAQTKIKNPAFGGKKLDQLIKEECIKRKLIDSDSY